MHSTSFLTTKTKTLRSKASFRYTALLLGSVSVLGFSSFVHAQTDGQTDGQTEAQTPSVEASSTELSLDLARQLSEEVLGLSLLSLPKETPLTLSKTAAGEQVLTVPNLKIYENITANLTVRFKRLNEAQIKVIQGTITPMPSELPSLDKKATLLKLFEEKNSSFLIGDFVLLPERADLSLGQTNWSGIFNIEKKRYDSLEAKGTDSVITMTGFTPSKSKALNLYNEQRQTELAQEQTEETNPQDQPEVKTTLAELEEAVKKEIQDGIISADLVNITTNIKNIETTIDEKKEQIAMSVTGLTVNVTETTDKNLTPEEKAQITLGDMSYTAEGDGAFDGYFQMLKKQLSTFTDQLDTDLAIKSIAQEALDGLETLPKKSIKESLFIEESHAKIFTKDGSTVTVPFSYEQTQDISLDSAEDLDYSLNLELSIPELSIPEVFGLKMKPFALDIELEGLNPKTLKEQLTKLTEDKDLTYSDLLTPAMNWRTLSLERDALSFDASSLGAGPWGDIVGLLGKISSKEGKISFTQENGMLEGSFEEDLTISDIPQDLLDTFLLETKASLFPATLSVEADITGFNVESLSNSLTKTPLSSETLLTELAAPQGVVFELEKITLNDLSLKTSDFSVSAKGEAFPNAQSNLLTVEAEIENFARFKDSVNTLYSDVTSEDEGIPGGNLTFLLLENLAEKKGNDTLFYKVEVPSKEKILINGKEPF